MMTRPEPVLRRRASRLLAAGMLAFLLVATLAPANLPPATANEFTIEFAGNPRDITGAGLKAVFPQVQVDGNGNTHMIYLIEDAPGSNRYDLVYRNNIGNTQGFNAAQMIERGANIDRNPSIDMALGPDGMVHVVYTNLGKDSKVYYERAIPSGGSATFTGQVPLTSGRAFFATIAVDANNTSHVAWIDKGCGNGQIVYRTVSSGGSPGGTSAPVATDCNDQGDPAITIANGKPQLVFAYKGVINYSRLDPGGWTAPFRVSRASTENPNIKRNEKPQIASDGTQLFVAWDEVSGSHDIFFRRLQSEGAQWSNAIGFSTEPGFAAWPHVAYSATAQRAYVVWSDDDNATATEVRIREFDVATGTTTRARQLTNQANVSDWPVIHVNGRGVAIAWQDRAPDNVLSAWYLGGTSGPALSAQPKLEGGAQFTNKASLALTFENISGGANQARVQWDTPFSNANTPPEFQPFGNLTSVNAPQNLASDVACEQRTLYAQARVAGGAVQGGSSFTRITFDRRVQALVFASNPRISGMMMAPADTSVTGPMNGHPSFTRVPRFWLQISDPGDCSGLATFRVQGQASETALTNGSFSGGQWFPGENPATDQPDIASGLQQFVVTVRDNAGNFGDSTVRMVYDTEPPAVRSADVSVDANTRRVLRTLTFSNVNVSDYYYGTPDTAGATGVSLPDGKRFWGVWIANWYGQDIGPNDPRLVWMPIQVTDPAASTFSIQWSVFAGLGFGLDRDKPGTYYVYIRFLDGAGNPSAATVSPSAGPAGTEVVAVQLDAGYEFPFITAPIIRK